MTGFTIKLIALISMLIDHTVKAGLIHPTLLTDAWGLSPGAAYVLMLLLEIIGRLAFPIFVYMAAEGLRYTRSRRRYMLQLLLFGLLSEFAFDMAVCPLPELPLSWFTPFTSLNVFFTLFLGAIGVDQTERLLARGKNDLFAALPAALCVLAGTLFGVDYMGFGVLMIFAAYFPSEKSRRLGCMALIQAVLYLGHLSGWFTAFSSAHLLLFGASCIPLFLLLLYNGQRGPNIKYLFYAAYPAHLYLLLLIRWLQL